jgi:UDP-galactopyranose mutase
VKEKELLARYVDLARKEANTTFIGRLGTYRYLDMHVAISEALRAADRFIAANPTVQSMPAFTVDPLQ